MKLEKKMYVRWWCWCRRLFSAIFGIDTFNDAALVFCLFALWFVCVCVLCSHVLFAAILPFVSNNTRPYSERRNDSWSRGMCISLKWIITAKLLVLLFVFGFVIIYSRLNGKKLSMASNTTRTPVLFYTNTRAHIHTQYGFVYILNPTYFFSMIFQKNYLVQGHGERERARNLEMSTDKWFSWQSIFSFEIYRKDLWVELGNEQYQIKIRSIHLRNHFK